jgi:hypothetical protein
MRLLGGTVLGMAEGKLFEVAGAVKEAQPFEET